MSKRQLKKILTVLGGVVSILFLALLVNNYFNIYLFLGSIFLNCCNVYIKNNKRENNNVREYSNRSCNKNAVVTYSRMLIVINLVKQRLELEERISFVKSYQ